MNGAVMMCFISFLIGYLIGIFTGYNINNKQDETK